MEPNRGDGFGNFAGCSGQSVTTSNPSSRAVVLAEELPAADIEVVEVEEAETPAGSEQGDDPITRQIRRPQLQCGLPTG